MTVKYLNFKNFKVSFFILACTLIVMGLYGGCGGGGDDVIDTGGDLIKEVTIDGTISDIVAKNPANQRSSLTTRIKNLIQIIETAMAQEGEEVSVQAFNDENMLVAETIVDENGNFSIEVPCDTDLTLVFSFGGLSVETGVFNFPCTGGEEVVDVGEEDYDVDGGGGACIITAGDCDLKIIAGSVSLFNCSNCIDTRGNSSVITMTTKFSCTATNDGIRAVGTSTAQVLIGELPEMTDGTIMMTENGMEMITQLQNEDPDIDINAGGDGVNAKGNALVVLSTIVDEELSLTGGGSFGGDGGGDGGGDESGGDCVAQGGEGNCGMGQGQGGGNGTPNEGGGQGSNNKSFDPNGNINVEGADHGIIAVSTSKVEVEGENCSFSPIPGTETKGNAEIEVDCGG